MNFVEYELTFLEKTCGWVIHEGKIHRFTVDEKVNSLRLCARSEASCEYQGGRSTPEYTTSYERVASAMNEKRKDNLVPFIEAFDDIDRMLVVEALHWAGHSNAHIGLLAFFDRHVVIDVLRQRVTGMDPRLELHQRINRIISGLSIEPEWIDVTCLTDTRRKEMHVITGEIREGEDMGLLRGLERGWFEYWNV